PDRALRLLAARPRRLARRARGGPVGERSGNCRRHGRRQRRILACARGGVRRRARTRGAAVTAMTYCGAGILAGRQEMTRDHTVWALGEDLAEGGANGQYRGLRQEFGPERVLGTPISESTIMGAGVGAAIAGTRPVIELRYVDFAICAADEIVNQA